jgi:hypothetical protein
MSKIKDIGTAGLENSLARRSALKRIALACGAIGGAVAGFGRTRKALAGKIDVNGPGGSHVSTYVSQGKHNVTYSSSR